MSIGPYRIIEALGSGANGEVYLAEDVRLGRKVAVKTLSALDSKQLADAQRWVLREARAAARLNHPHIASVYDVIESPQGAHIVMEYVRGETLAARLRTGPLPAGDVLAIAIQLTDALAEAHGMGVVHRDLKPANVVLTPKGDVKILDFGLAQVRPVEPGSTPVRSSRDFTLDGRQIGTPPYMPPEHLMGDPVDARGDIYSLGVMLYELLTGRRPFRGPDAMALTLAILTEPTPKASGSNPAVPEALDAVVFRAMSRLPQDRYASAGEMAADLRRLAHEIEASPTRSRPGRHLRRPSARSWFAAGLASMAVLAVAVALAMSSRVKVQPTRGSIAVLPLRNLSADPENEYFSDGITEDIIAQLSKMRDLKVISANSVMAYKNSQKSPRDVGRELDVSAVLEGSVRREGSQVRIVSKLSDAKTSEQLWAETYDRELKDVLAIQSEVSRQIALALKGRLSSVENDRLDSRHTPSFEVFDLYLKGRYHWNQRTEEGLKRALNYFQQAADRDPRYALAYVGLADTYNLLEIYGYMPHELTTPRARTAALKALGLDDLLGEAHASLALVRHQNLEWTDAEASFKRAIALSPSYATAHHWYANYLAHLGRLDEAMREIKRAQELDPLSVSISCAVGEILNLQRRYDEAVRQLRTALRIDPTFSLTQTILAETYAAKGDHEQAIAEIQDTTALPMGERRTLLAYFHALAGRKDQALTLLSELSADQSRQKVRPVDMAAVYVALGRNDEAFVWLQRAYADRPISLAYLKVDPRFDPLRVDPRFAQLVRSLGLTA